MCVIFDIKKKVMKNVKKIKCVFVWTFRRTGRRTTDENYGCEILEMHVIGSDLVFRTGFLKKTHHNVDFLT